MYAHRIGLRSTVAGLFVCKEQRRPTHNVCDKNVIQNR